MAMYLKNSSIGGGSVVDMMTRKLTTVWNVDTQEEPEPGKATLPWNPSEVDFVTAENQIFDVEGHFCEGSPVASNGSSAMQFPLLGSFCNMGSPSWLIYDSYILTGYGSTQVIPRSPKVTTSFRNEDEADYSVQLIETKAW